MTPATTASRRTDAAEITPPTLGLARLRVPGFARLASDERLQAAALALTRDLGVADGVRVAASAAPNSPDEALVAYCSPPSPATAKPVSTRLLGLMQPGKIYWIDAPHGYVIGENGAAAIETGASGTDAAASAHAGVTVHHALPSAVVAAMGAVARSSTAQCLLVNRDRSALPDDTLDFWRAASGMEIVDGAPPLGESVELIAPRKPRIRVEHTPLDRALRGCSAAALACAALAAVQLASVSAPSPVASGSRTTPVAGAGALFERISVIAPEVPANLQSATFASGAWVLSLAESTDVAALQRASTMLQANGLSVQSTRLPAPRLRVALP